MTSCAYNRQGERTKFTDPNGTVHEYDYDAFSCQTADRVTTVGKAGCVSHTSVL